MNFNEKNKLYGDDITYVLIKIDELRNNEELSHQEYFNGIISIIYSYIPQPCLYKGSPYETAIMINNNINDLSIIRNCLL